ncbi:50S ribosomal protein L20 [candidate division KSB1 bacterium]|nr:50S ribosomal protein L20 [candidate division KSB1 bacterium]
MPRSHSPVVTRHRRNKYLKAAKGYYGGKHRLYRSARETVEKGLTYSYRDRRARRRDFRSLWIVRINAAAHLYGMNYSSLISALKKNNIAINRKILADLAVNDLKAFEQLVEAAKV